MAWTAGQTLHNGKYTIEKELGRGRLGITYLVKDKAENSLVIRTLDEDLLNKLTAGQRSRLETQFTGEALKLERCKHLHVVKVQENFIEDQLFCVGMEYMVGNTLETLAQKALPEKEALGYIRQIAEALIEVHSKDLLHRDVKPANVMIRAGTSELVLIDFELAGEFDHPLTARGRDQPFAPMELSSSKIPRGTYTDVYSLAATLYFLVTGQSPVSALERKHDNASLIPPKEINPEISDQVNNAILKGMALVPEERPQTIQEWLDLLGLKRSISMPRLKSNTMTVLIAVAVVAAVIVPIVALIANLRSPSSEPKPSVTPKSQITPTKTNVLS
jgi:serine/threonine-protein kinase